MGSITRNLFNPSKSLLNPLNTPVVGKLHGQVQRKLHNAFGLQNVPTPYEAHRSIEKEYLGGSD